jgi:signal transduction histidine kinase
MTVEAALHRQIRSNPATLGLASIVLVFALAPLFPVVGEVLGVSPALSVPLGGFAVAWSLATTLAFRRRGLASPAYRWMNRGETLAFSSACVFLICSSGNPTNALWVPHFAHIVTCATSGSERRYNSGLFLAMSVAAAGWFGVLGGLWAGAIAGAVGGLSVYVYRVMSATSAQLSQTLRQRDALEARLTRLALSEERARIARDLHDGVGAELSSLFWQLQALRQRATTPESQGHFEQLTARITQSTDELRNVVWELRATSLAWPELIAHLRTRCAELAQGEATVTVIADGPPTTEIDAELRMHVARIAQEAVRNAIHHGKARAVVVSLCVTDALRLTVDDDGHGIAPDAARRSVGGLRNIDTRVRNLGGEFSIIRREDAAGTRLLATMPLAPGGAKVAGAR